MAKAAPERATKLIYNFTRPHDPSKVLEYVAERLKSVTEENPNGTVGQPNASVIPQADIDAHVKAYNAAVEAFNNADTPADQAKVKFPAPLPPIYCIALVDAAINDHALCAIGRPVEGKGGKAPQAWKANQPGLGGWQPGMRIADPLKQQIRGHHAHDVRRLVRDREENVLTIGRMGDFVVGNSDDSAINLIAGSITGCNLAIHLAVHKLAFDGNAAINSIVGRINAKPAKMKMEDGTEQVVQAGGMIEWGYLVRSGKKMTYAQIRAAAAEDGESKGITFESADRIVGTPISKAKLVTEVKRRMSLAATRDEDGATDWDRFIARPKKGEGPKRSPEECVAQNIATQCRLNPASISPYGIAGTQIGLPLFTCFTGETASNMTECVNTVINGRFPVKEMETERDAKYRLTPEETPTEAASDTPTTGKGKSKGKSQGKKAARKKVSGKKTAAKTEKTKTSSRKGRVVDQSPAPTVQDETADAETTATDEAETADSNADAEAETVGA